MTAEGQSFGLDLVEALTNYFLVSWVSTEEQKEATENVSGYFTTVTFFITTSGSVVCWKMWIKILVLKKYIWVVFISGFRKGWNCPMMNS